MSTSKLPQTANRETRNVGDPADSLVPTILVVDDEHHIHSSLRLRLGENYRLISATSPKEALACVAREPMDLCIVDIHMPGMNGFSFIEEARKADPELGYVVLTAFDSDENLRRAIPLQVLEFIPKPLPERSELERNIPDWVERIRARRREAGLAKDSARIMHDLEVAQIERDVESTASESAREALLQSASLLTTAQAVLLNASLHLEASAKGDPRLTSTMRYLSEARKQVEAAANITEGYFGSAYADRDNSPALVDACARHAAAIATRIARAADHKKLVDYQALGRDLLVAELTGIDFLLLLVPTLVRALELSTPGTTVRVVAEPTSRIDETCRAARNRDFLWVNRRHAFGSRPGVMLTISGSGAAPSEAEAGLWLRDSGTGQMRSSSRGLVRGIQKARGLLGLSVGTGVSRFTMVIVLPL
jgi:CheY-like chemotaxis protein